MTETTEIQKYGDAARLLDDHLRFHIGEGFTLDDACKWCVAVSSQGRKWIATRLGELVEQNILEKSRTFRGSLYKYVNKDKKYIRYLDYKDNDEIDISWPKAHGDFDNSAFGFDGHITVRPADIIVVAGLSNWGKSTFCRNFIAENMDKHKCQMMVNEYSPGRFARVISRMGWTTWANPDGTERVPLIERHDDWKYAIEPDWINVIDWISLTTDFYLIRQIMEGIQETLRGGIALIVLQKREGRDLGEGGGMTEDRASVYFNIDQGVLTVRKVKEAKGGVNPTGTKYGFSIVNGGAEFANIRPVKICPKCGGKKTCWVKGEGTVACSECGELGYVDKR